MKLVYVFSKKGRLRFVSHLDLQRFLMRALNRTCLPIAFSQGFNPHPLLSIAGALAMGYESDYEVFEVKIDKEIDLQTALATMQAALPEELFIKEVQTRPDNYPSLTSLVTMADYEIKPQKEAEILCKAAETFRQMTSCMGIRKSKSGEKEVDVRALCLNIETHDFLINARLMLTEKDTLKPDLLIKTLSGIAGIAMPDCRVCRKALLGTDKSGKVRLITEL